MKIRQNAKHLAARAALGMPLVGPKMRRKLVEIHTRVFLERTAEAKRADRRPHLDRFFDGTVDMYLAMLGHGLSEAQARELVHIVANVEFARMGWTEMMEFPVAEIGANLARYEPFLHEHGADRDRPLGDFTPEGGLPESPGPAWLTGKQDTPYAEAGYADDTYVEDAEGRIRKGDVTDDPILSKRSGR